MALTKVAPAGIGSTPGDGYRIGSSFLHATGAELTNVNATGVITATKFVGDIAVGSSISYADNEKAYFGNSQDLSIYHSGSDSFIKDSGTGDLKIQGGADVVIGDTSGANSAVFNTDGSVELYYRGTGAGKKFETSGIGVTISSQLDTGNLKVSGVSTFTGSIDVDGHTELDNVNVSGVSTFAGNVKASNKLFVNIGSTNPALEIQRSGSTKAYLTPESGEFRIQTNGSEDLALQCNSGGGSSGDINLKSGSTALLTAKGTGNLGINQSAPEALLHIEASSSGASWSADAADTLILERNGGCVIDFRTPAANDGGLVFSDNSSRAQGTLLYLHSDNSLRIGTDGAERFRIDSKGQISSRGTSTAYNGTGALDALQLYYETDSGQATVGSYSSGGSTHLSFFTNSGGNAGTEKLRIASDGKVGIGTNTLPSALTVMNSATPHIRFGYKAGQDHRLAWDSSKVFLSADPDNDTNNSGLGLQVDGSTKLYIDDSGKVGINQSTPTEDLEVKGDQTATIYINAGTHDASTANEATLKLGFNQSHANDSIGYVKLVEGGGNSFDGSLVFGVPFNNSGTPATREPMTIKHSGNVGIGTDLPSSIFDVQMSNRSGINFTNSANNAVLDFRSNLVESCGRIRVDESGNGGFMDFYTKNTSGTITKRLSLNVNGTVESLGSIQCLNKLESASGNDLLLNANGANRDVKIQVNGTNRMYVKGDVGNIGIGIDAPEHRLHIKHGNANSLLKLESGDATVSMEFWDNSTSNGNQALIGAKGNNFYVETGGAERMRIDDSGRLLVNRTSTHASSSERLSVNGMASFQNNTTTNSPLYCFNEDTTGSGAIQPFFFAHDGGGIRIGLGVQRSTGLAILNMQHGHSFRSGSSGVSGTEKMRITSGQGKVRIGMNSFDSGPSASNHGIEFANTNSASHWSATGTTAANHIIWMNPNGTCGSIKTHGTTTSYNTSSDYRLKENVVSISDAITRVKNLSPIRFNWISDSTNTLQDGFLAHEVAPIVPEAVSGTKDAVELEDTDYATKDDIIPQQLDAAKLVPLLTAALQEAITEIETLKTKVAALESS